MVNRFRSKLIASTVVLSLFSVAIVVGPTLSMRWWDRRVERLAENGRMVEAEAEARRLIQSTPDRPRPRLILARIARKQGRITEAEETLQRAVELGLDIEQARLERALILRREDDSARAN